MNSLPRILLVVDDWEALERYEDKLAPRSASVEAWPLGREGLKRAAEAEFDWILVDLILEDLTPTEAHAELGAHPPVGSPRLIYVGSPAEIQDIPEESGIKKLNRPFEWTTLLRMLEHGN